jgi:hypothetical protein
LSGSSIVIHRTYSLNPGTSRYRRGFHGLQRSPDGVLLRAISSLFLARDPLPACDPHSLWMDEQIVGDDELIPGMARPVVVVVIVDLEKGDRTPRREDRSRP